MTSPIRQLLVHLDAAASSTQRLRAALALAQRQRAGVRALYAVTPSLLQVPFPVDIGGAATAALQAFDDRRRDDARAAFEALRQHTSTPMTWTEAPIDSGPVACVIQQAWYADLLVLGQRNPQPNPSGLPADFVESVLIGSGRPALVVPWVELPPSAGDCVLVAWKESAASARALHAALPLLATARKVHVACWGGDARAVRQLLARHGIEAEVHAQEQEPAEIGELILSLAADLSADLLVTGCYGHSRARELVLGGATRTLLKSMTLPVLMSH